MLMLDSVNVLVNEQRLINAVEVLFMLANALTNYKYNLIAVFSITTQNIFAIFN